MSKQYLYRVSILNRKNSHPLEAICYYSGENQYDILNSKNYTSNTVDNVIWNKISVPSKEEQISLYKELPEYLKFRSSKKDAISNARNILWQNVFTREKRDDAQFSRLFELSIPAFLSQQEAVNSLSRFSTILVNEGMIVDCSVHSRQKSLNNLSLLDRVKMGEKADKEQEEVHETSLDYNGYLMCTLRDYKEGRFVNKNREWNDKKKMESWRGKWVEILAELVHNSNLPKELRESWEEKLTIYGEYEKIKQNLKSNDSTIKLMI